MNVTHVPALTAGFPQQADTITVGGARILCIADIKGCLSQLNQLARDANAQCIIHTGNFGFYDRSSLGRISDKVLKHLIQYSVLIPPYIRSRFNNSPITQVRRTIETSPHQHYLSQLPDFLSHEKLLEVPVYTSWGVCEDVAILEKLLTGVYSIPNLHILHEATSYVLNTGGIKLRLLGLGGAIIPHKLFDNGEGASTIAGGSGMMWSTALQIGQLVDTAQKVYDPSETRILVTHASPGREGLLAQLSLYLNVDFTISAGLHFKYGTIYNEFSCQPDEDHYKYRLLEAQQKFLQLWNAVKDRLESYVDDNQAQLLRNTLKVVNCLPPSLSDSNDEASSCSYSGHYETASKSLWNFNLPDAAFGWMVLDINNGHVGAEMSSQGLDFTHRLSSTSSGYIKYPQTSYIDSSISTFPPNPSVNRFKPSDSQQLHHKLSCNSTIDGKIGNFNDANDDSTSKEEQGSCQRPRRRNSMRTRYAIFVGGLKNDQVTEDDIREFFDPKAVTDVRIPINPETKLHKSHCYVDFADSASCDAALAKNGQVLNGDKVFINRSTRRPPRGTRHGCNGRGRDLQRPPGK